MPNRYLFHPILGAIRVSQRHSKRLKAHFVDVPQKSSRSFNIILLIRFVSVFASKIKKITIMRLFISSQSPLTTSTTSRLAEPDRPENLYLGVRYLKNRGAPQSISQGLE